MQNWKATHRIKFKHNSDAWRDASWDVMLIDGAAYTRVEWDATDKADWEQSKDGRWWFHGKPSPGLGTVTIEAL